MCTFMPLITYISVSPSIPDGITSSIVSQTKSEKQDINSTSFPDEKNNTSLQIFREGDTVMFTCTGNIGNPPGYYIWQMCLPQQDRPIIYSNETTEKEDIFDKCYFRGTSNLTVQISENHLKSKFRCFEESYANVVGMYVETEPLNVHCEYMFFF